MQANVDDDDLIKQLQLTPDEMLTVHALRLQLMQTDMLAEKRWKQRLPKQARVKEFHEAFLAAVGDAARGAELPDLFDAGVAAKRAGVARDRSRALIIVIELLTFNPWSPDLAWIESKRQESLAVIAGQLASLGQDDYVTVIAEFDSLMKQLKRKTIRWGRVAVMSAVGLGAGVVTAGWAAPVVGGLIGGSLGLTGAAATSAGLAMLGGGSVAAGGFGVAGGTILLSGLGGVFVAGAAGAGTLYSPVGTAAVIADAIKLDLLAKMVLNDSEDRDQKMRRVAESLQQRINEFSDKINLLSERIATLKAEKGELVEENARLRDEIESLKQDRENTEKARVTMEVVLDRLPIEASIRE